MPFDVESYRAAQQQRLEEIRRATEKERQLLAFHEGALATAATVDSVQPQTATVAATVAGGGRWQAVGDRAVELHALDAALVAEERELERETFALDRRLHAAEQQKTALLSRLALLQHREALAAKQEEQVEQMAADAERKSRGVEAFLQEFREERQAMDARVAEKRARLDAAKLAAKDQQKKRQAVEVRSRSQVEELQDRIRERRLELMKRGGVLSDKERLLRQEQSRLRETELAAIYRLRKEIELMEASLYGDRECQ